MEVDTDNAGLHVSQELSESAPRRQRLFQAGIDRAHPHSRLSQRVEYRHDAHGHEREVRRLAPRARMDVEDVQWLSHGTDGPVQ